MSDNTTSPTTDRAKTAIDLISDVIRRLQRRASINQDPHLLDWIGNLEDARNLLREEVAA